MTNRRHIELASESQSVGWISSTDAMLLFVAILTLVAMVFQQQWAAAENQLSDTETRSRIANSELAAQLAKTEADLKRLRDLVAGTDFDYAKALVKFEDQDHLLANAFAYIDELQQWLDQQLAENGVLEGRVEAGQKQAEKYEDRIGKLERLVSDLKVTIKQSLSQIELQSRELAAQRLELDEKNIKVAKLNAEIAMIKMQLESSQGEIDSLRSKIAKLMNELASQSQEIARSERSKMELAQEVARLKATITQRDLTIVELQEKITELNSRIEQLRIAGRKIKAENQDLRNRVGEQMQETDIRRELVGIKGKLGRVAILFDASESMKTSGRWDNARKVVESWVSHLDMQECRVIVFNSFIKTFPADKEVIDLKGPNGDQGRRELADFLGGIEPQYRTNTRLALEEAYKMSDLDTIVLFTDGAPTDATLGVYSKAEAEAIYSLIKKRPGIPINAVGIGAYFDPEFSDFLLKVAEFSNGSYLGR